MNIGIEHYLIVSSFLFVIGMYTVATRRHAVAILMGVELLLNSASINFVAFSHFVEGGISGYVFSLFIIVLAAAEAAVALAIVLSLFRNTNTVDVTESVTLQG